MKYVKKRKPTQTQILSQQAIYGRVAQRTDEYLNLLFSLLDSPNKNLAFAAAKTLLNKVLPDVKSVELKGENGEPIRVSIIGNYLAQRGWNVSAPAASTAGSNTIQDINLAPTGSQNINSTGEDGSRVS